MNLDQFTSSVVRVGGGRGFVVQDQERFRSRLIITAAHCLPFFPPPHAAAYLEERTFQDLLGPIDEETSIWAECLFVDPIADIAVLGGPDSCTLPDQFEGYEDLFESLSPIQIADAPEECSAWLLSLDKRWCPCNVTHYGGRLWLSQADDGIRGGMSGSPVMLTDGSAIGIIGTAGGPTSRLTHDLPGWCLQALPKG
jgi:hypothetical protein